MRSTFSAELNGLIDSLEIAILIQVALHQIYVGCTTDSATMAKMLDEGKLQPPLDAVIDAKAVFDAIAAIDACNPTESSLKLHLLSIRDRIAARTLRRVFWADTRDMVADCMTKGGVLRTMIQNLCEKGRITLQHEFKEHSKYKSVE